tara:strand:- start:2044 stop:3993 length:1950 start_codon:yes stop_codon:yes gene_type:complete
MKKMFSGLRSVLLSKTRFVKQSIAAFVDFLCVYFSTLMAYYFSFLETQNLFTEDFFRFLWVPFLTIVVFSFSGVYKTVLRFIDFSAIYLILKSILVVLVVILASKVFLYNLQLSNPFNFIVAIQPKISFAGWVLGSLSSILLIIGSRLFANFFFTYESPGKRVVIYGAGSAGVQLASALSVSPELNPIAYLDKDPSIQNTYLGGIKVLSPHKLRKLVTKKKVEEVLIAIPSAPKAILRNLLKEIEEYSVKVRILPGLAELAQGKVVVSELKEVNTSDLLGRYEVEANQNLLNKNIQEKVVLITGAGGSIGSEIANQVSNLNPKILIILDSNEFALYKVKNKILSNNPELKLYSVIASITNKRRILDVCNTFEVNTIYHAAAYKHVPLVEENPFEGVSNNILGTKACIEAAIDSKVETFVLISTDKAVRPTNIMGATKRFAEMILQAYSLVEDYKDTTRMTMVRFGNVVGSSGSAIPLFQQQIKEGGPVTVTDPEVTRYFMSIPEAAELVIQAGAMGKGGDVFVLDMGEPVKIFELAKRLIKLSGMELKDESNPDGDIEIVFTGLRPGEKLYEELLIGDNVSTTEHKQILRAEEDFLSANDLEGYFESLREAEIKGDVKALREILKKVISGFTPEEDIVDVVYLQKNIQT